MSRYLWKQRCPDGTHNPRVRQAGDFLQKCGRQCAEASAFAEHNEAINSEFIRVFICVRVDV